MRNLLITLLVIFVSSIVMGQTENYVQSTTYQVKTTDGDFHATTSADPLSADDKIEAITYYDGLGRPKQSISKQAGGNRQDIITPVVYDAYGRQTKEYLPYADSLQSSIPNLDFRNQEDLITDLTARYLVKFPSDLDSNLPNPYSDKLFELSPLNRVLEQGAPGEDWALENVHTVKLEYRFNSFDENDPTNVNNDNVRLFKVIFPTGDTEDPELFSGGYYQENQLYKTITKDENWQPNIDPEIEEKNHTTEEFKNKQGQIILKRTFNNDVEHDTYYVYDDFGNLTYVMAPQGIDNLLLKYKGKAFIQIIPFTEFIPTDIKGAPLTTGSGFVEIDSNPINAQVKVTFDLHLDDPIELLTGKIIQLDNYLPNMIIGSITSGLNTYVVSIIDSALYISGSGAIIELTGSLIATMPMETPNPNILDEFCYQYHYDKRNRLIEKKIPGKGWEFIVYNVLDKPVLTQDALLRERDDWLFTKYDAFGRVVYTGKHNFRPFDDGNGLEEDSGRKQLQEDVNDEPTINHESRNPNLIGGITLYHSNIVIPRDQIEVYTINYYDTYSNDITGVDTEFQDPVSVSIDSETYDTTTDTKTLTTGTRVRVLGTNQWVTSVLYYDDKGRPIYSAVKNDYLSTVDVTKTAFDFVGKVLQTENIHEKGTLPIIEIKDRFVYDHMGRILTQKQQINNNPFELLTINTYDELGQLTTKGVGGIEGSPIQMVDYDYNIRGWLKQINDVNKLENDLFGFKINYNTSEYNTQVLYNGNISETIWNTKSVFENPLNNSIEETEIKRAYGYSYDHLNRIKMGVYEEEGNIRDGFYNLKEVDYDKNGNIIELRRSGADDSGNELSWMDNLSYNYEGNRLIDIKETGSHNYGFKINTNAITLDYEYDVNGNMTKDYNKEIDDITYNHLNLPTSVAFDANNFIEYQYDATGVKLSKTVTENSIETVTRYAGNYVYEETTLGEELKFFNHPEGYAEPEKIGFGNPLNPNFTYIYQYKDHLGNIRLSYNRGTYKPLIESAFYEEYEGWDYQGANGSIEIEDEKLKVNVLNDYNGVKFTLGEDFNIGNEVRIHLDLDKATTDKIRIILIESDLSGNSTQYTLNGNTDTGVYDFTHTIVDKPILKLRIDNSNTSDATPRHFYLDDVYASTGKPEIVEENNYYPFGLKHKGYNNVVTSTNPAQDYMYNGVELEESLGLDLYEMDFRQYDPAIARFTSVDPITHYSLSTYTAFDNNPILFADPLGADSETHWKSDFMNRNGGHWSDSYKSGANPSKAEDRIDKTQLDDMVKEKGTSRVVDGLTYSYIGDAPKMISLDNDTDEMLLIGIIEWSVYINSGNSSHLSDIIDIGETAPSDLSFDSVKTRELHSNDKETIEIGYIPSYFERNNAFSDHLINVVYLNDRVGNNESISFYTSVYNDPNKQPIVMWVQSKTYKFIGRLRRAIEDRTKEERDGIKHKSTFKD